MEEIKIHSFVHSFIIDDVISLNNSKFGDYVERILSSN